MRLVEGGCGSEVGGEPHLLLLLPQNQMEETGVEESVECVCVCVCVCVCARAE